MGLPPSGWTSRSRSAPRPVCTSGPASLNGNTVTFTGAGTVTITASQAGNTNWNAAANVAQTFTVNPAPQTITFSNPGTQHYASPLALNATASSAPMPRAKQ